MTRYFREGRNAVWGGFTLGATIGFIIAIIFWILTGLLQEKCS